MEMLRLTVHSYPVEDGWDELAVLERALADRTAFAPLYERYSRRIFQYLLTRCDSPDDAADLMQVVFLRALEALPSLRQRQPGSFAAWLFRIAHNTATDSRRRRRPTIPWEHVPEIVLFYPGPGPEAATVQRETLNVLRMMVSEQSRERQELLALRFAGELSVAEIAAIVGKKEAAVRKQLLRTIHALQERFDAYGF
jgi:RNA polymerase sigma-70 factor (ECF subfamily)